MLCDARTLEQAGAYAIVLEAIPADIAREITEAVAVPTIGIGAGMGCDGQVLVSYDALGMDESFKPRFVRRYAQLGMVIKDAIAGYVADVRSGAFPSDAESFSKAIPDIQKIEILSSQRSGKGTKFRETRLMGGRVATAELTIAEFEQDQRIRMDSDIAGAHWSTLFTIESEGPAVGLQMSTVTIPRSWSARLMLPCMLGMIRKALESDLDAIKHYCEQ